MIKVGQDQFGDLAVREVYREELRGRHSDDPSTIIVDELGLCQGVGRVDMAVINGKIHGIEIKSERDSLERIESQLKIYGQCLDSLTVVAAKKHIKPLRSIVPAWCGLVEVIQTEAGIKTRLIRKEKRNPNINPLSLVQLVWRDEALIILRKYGQEKGLTSKPREILWRKLVEFLSLDQLRAEVISCLKSRKHWRLVD